MIALIAMCAIAHAQKNSILVMGNVGFNVSGSNDTAGRKETTASTILTPAVGYQVSDRWTFGLMVDFVSNSRKNTDPSNPTGDLKTKSTNVNAGVFARNTIPITDLLFLAVNGALMYTNLVASANGTNNSMALHAVQLRVTPNIGLNIKKGYALNFGFGDLSASYASNKAGAATYNAGVNFGRAFTFGLTKNFISHKKNAQAGS